MGDVITINRTPKDFVAKTRHLSVEDRGAYQEILDQIVILGQDDDPPSLPDNDRFIANLLGWSVAKWKATKKRLCEGRQAVLIVEGNRISQTRIVEEIEAARLRIQQASKAGSASAAARQQLRQRMLNGGTNASSTPVGTRVQLGGQLRGNSDPNSEATPTPTSHESRVMKETTETTSPPSLSAPEARSKTRARKEPVGTSKELVEAFTLGDDHRLWAAQNCPSVPIETETDTWRDRCRERGYRTNAGPIRDAAASWRTSMKNAEQWGTYTKKGNGNANGRRADSGSARAGADPEIATRAAAIRDKFPVMDLKAILADVANEKK